MNEYSVLFLSLPRFCLVSRPSVFAKWGPLKLSSYSVTGARAWGCYLFEYLHLKEMVHRSLRKIFLAKRLREGFHITKKGREIIYNCKFFKVNSLRKKWSGDCSPKETYLKFIQGKKNIKNIFIIQSSAA